VQTIDLTAALVYTAAFVTGHSGDMLRGSARLGPRQLHLFVGRVQARTQRTLPNQALDCVDHKHGPNRKLYQIPVENPVSITGGSGPYPDR